MTNATLALRYAHALFDLSVERGVLDDIQNQLNFFADTVRDQRDLSVLLNHPNISYESKKELITNIFSTYFSDMMLDFALLLIDRRRQDLLDEIRSEFDEMANKRRNIVVAKLSSATPLTTEQTDRLHAAIEQYTGKQIRLEIQSDPALIGGARLKIGDRVIDGSVSSALSKIKNELITSSLIPHQEVG
ncbi:MAG: F0F1 ATP synthase subunit delta [Anaerofustis sp.]